MSISKKKMAEMINALRKDVDEIRLSLNLTDPDKSNLKELTQSVFDGLDEKWRFAAVDRCGEAWLSTHKTQPSVSGTHLSPDPKADSMQARDYYDASDWQNSLIERDKVELTGSDLCRAMLERGDKFVVCRTGDGVKVVDVADSDRIKTTDRYRYRLVTPINPRTGEPLTAAEVGL